MTSQLAADLTARLTWTPNGDVVHGYPPPARPVGAVVHAYCGALMIVRGEYSRNPPQDTCAECIVVWRRERRGERC